MNRNKAYYSKKQIQDLILNGRVHITRKALESAKNDFGWDSNDICLALKVLKRNDFYKSAPRYQNPKIYVDYYKAPNLKGERVYTHFHVEDGNLIIESFKGL